jgi:ABC-type transport system involved in multi-copper enzyme maturation permease subunit
LITDEITAGTFTALRMTPISPITVVIGKLKATFFYAMIFIVSSIFIILAMAYLEQQTLWPDISVLSGEFWAQLMPKIKTSAWWGDFWKTYWRLVVWLVILLLSTISFLTSGLFASTLVKKTGLATAIGYGITAFICLISFAPIILQEQLGPTLSKLILSVNPIAGAMQISNDAFQEYPNLWINNIYTLIALNIIFLVGATIRTWILFREQK